MAILSYISLFLLVFDLSLPPIRMIGSAPYSLLISLGVILIGKENCSYHSVKSFSFPFFAVYGVIVFFAASRIIFSGELDYLLSLFKSLVIFTSSVLYIYAFGIKNIDNKIINIFFMNGVICFVAGSTSTLLDLVYMFKNGAPEAGFIPYRNAFLSGSGYFGIASAYALVIVLCANKLIRDGVSIGFIFKFLVIMIAGVLAGRTAFVGIIFAYLYLISKSFKYSVLGLFIVGVLVTVILSFESISVYSSWLFEFISVDGNSINLSRTSSTDELSNMYFMPSNDSTWLWGDGRYVDGNFYYMNTDAGYMRNLFFGGLPFLIFVFMYAFLFLYKAKSLFFTLFIFPLILLLHYKGAFILNNPAGIPILTLVSYWFYKQRQLLVDGRR